MLNYLLSPEFQIVNTAGKPCTGHLEVYISGSRERYYCASDFNGTLWPFQVPLDSLGSNVVLADDSQAYDVYIYNRYGGELMSRYNVHPGAGGGIGVGNITSSDGSIIVTQIANGVDLRTNSTPPSILRATADTLYMDGQFTFAEAQRDGQNAIVDAQGKVIVNEGWWHYDATVKLRWTGPAQNETQSVSLYTHNASDSMTFDLSFPHNETVQVSGEYKALNDSTQFILGVTGVPSGMVVELVDFGVHSIIGEGAGGSYDAGNGIIINESDRIISIDPDVVQEKLTAGNNITIEDNVISATAEPQQQADWTEADPTSMAYIENKPDLSVYATQTDLTNGLSTKQDVISDLATIRAGAAAGATAVQDADYVHTDENFTTADKTKLSGIEAGAEVNVRANWTESDTTSDAYIQNKPVNLVQDPNYVHTDNNYTDADVAKLAGIAVGAEVNVQADWSQTDSGADDYIKNKPTIPPSVTVDQTYSASSTNAQSGRAVAEAIGTVNAVPSSTSSDADKVLTVNSSGNAEWVTPTSITVDQTYDPTSTNPQSGTAVAGALGTLSIPTATSDLTNDSGFITASDVPVQDVTIDNVSVVNAQGVAEIPRQVNADWSSSAGASEILNKPDLSVYATNTALTNGLATKQDTISDLATIRSGAQAGATAVQPGDLATVATTGSYSDLTGTPTIPTATSDLQNDSGFITLSDVPAQVQSDWNESDTSDPAYIQNKPAIPVLPTMKELVAGTNITLTEGTTTVTITASAPVIGTITV